MKSIVILISGRGSNLRALLEAKLPCRFAAVISNRADAEGLEIARAHDIPTAVLSHRDYADRASFDAALAGAIDRHAPNVVALAGFMRILTDGFVRALSRQTDQHPPFAVACIRRARHPCARTTGRRKIHGCTVHFVSPDLDHGPIIIQAAVPVLHGDTEQTLSARVLNQEHRIYPQAVKWLCDEKIHLDHHGKVIFRNRKQSGFALVSPSLE